MKTTLSKIMVIAGILIIITVVLALLIRNVDDICFYGFKRICNDSGYDDVIGLHNNADSYLNRRYLQIKLDNIGYYLTNSRSCEVKENNGDSESSQYPSHCIQNRNLREYKKEDVVRCLDVLSVKKNRRPMHIAFIGDSTVRQHFFSFIRLIPNYDRKTVSNYTTFAEYAFHEDMNVTSHLLDNLRVSFYWRNLIRNDLIDDFRQWASNNNKTQAPDFILLGVTAHHLLVNNNASKNLKMYENLLENELIPLLKQSLTVHPQLEIIWLRQSLTIEQFSPVENQVSYGIYPDKIKKYNAIVYRILKGTKVLMWDAINAIVEEYIRACTLIRFDRQDKHGYENCNDFIHPGFEAVSLGTRLLINHICYPSVSHNTQ